MSVHFFVRFEPRPGKEMEFRQELLRVIEASRAEARMMQAASRNDARKDPHAFDGDGGRMRRSPC